MGANSVPEGVQPNACGILALATGNSRLSRGHQNGPGHLLLREEASQQGAHLLLEDELNQLWTACPFRVPSHQVPKDSGSHRIVPVQSQDGEHGKRLAVPPSNLHKSLGARPVEGDCSQE